HLLAELGRGAFGRVFLARQEALAGRLVALKVAPNLLDEAQTLAQLQHTHIVPLYSVHRAGPLRAFCMPYFGSITLADVLQMLRGGAGPPVSGKALVDTLEACRSITARRGACGAERGTEPASTTIGSGAMLRVPCSRLRADLERLTYVEAV